MFLLAWNFAATGASPSRLCLPSHSEHQPARYKQTCHQIQQACGKRMRAVGEIAHHHRANKAAEIAYSVDQSDGGGGSRLAEKQSGHRPENRLKAVKRATRDNKKTDGNYQVCTVNN